MTTNITISKLLFMHPVLLMEEMEELFSPDLSVCSRRDVATVLRAQVHFFVSKKKKEKETNLCAMLLLLKATPPPDLAKRLASQGRRGAGRWGAPRDEETSGAGLSPPHPHPPQNLHPLLFFLSSFEMP